MSFDAAQYRASTAVKLGVPVPASLGTASKKRQAEFVAGRYCAMKAMRRLGWAAGVELSVGLNYAPLWPAGIVGSITHTTTFASAAVASTLYSVVNVFFELSDAEIFGIEVRTGDFRYRLLRDLSPEFCTGYVGSGRFELTQAYVHTGVELEWR